MEKSPLGADLRKKEWSPQGASFLVWRKALIMWILVNVVHFCFWEKLNPHKYFSSFFVRLKSRMMFESYIFFAEDFWLFSSLNFLARSKRRIMCCEDKTLKSILQSPGGPPLEQPPRTLPVSTRNSSHSNHTNASISSQGKRDSGRRTNTKIGTKTFCHVSFQWISLPLLQSFILIIGFLISFQSLLIKTRKLGGEWFVFIRTATKYLLWGFFYPISSWMTLCNLLTSKEVEKNLATKREGPL